MKPSLNNRGSASPIFLAVLALVLFGLSAYSFSISLKQQTGGNIAATIKSKLGINTETNSSPTVIPTGPAIPGPNLSPTTGTVASCKIQMPTGTIATGSPVVYVADQLNNRVQQFTTSGTFLLMFGWGVATGNNQFEICTSASCLPGIQGSGNGQFNRPSGITTDGFGNIYVADTFNHRIQKFNSVGTYLSQWGTQGTGSGQFNWPYGIAVNSSNNVYVADQSNHRIQQFTTSGTFLLMFGWGVQNGAPVLQTCTSGCQAGIQGIGNGQFNSAMGIITNSLGEVLVTDNNNARIQRFSSNGSYLSQWGSVGPSSGQLTSPGHIDIENSTGDIFVSEAGGNSRVQKFDSNGMFLSMFGWGVQNGAPVLQTCTSGCQAGISGSGNGQFNVPMGIALDNTSTVYVADTFNHRIQKFTSAGSYLSQWGNLGSGSGQFNDPYDAAVGCSLMPDLIVKSINFNPNTLHQSLPPSVPVNFSFDIFNTGQAPANISTSTHFRMYNTSSNQMVADIIPTTAFVLQPNQNYTFTNQNTFTVPNLHANLGTINLKMIADDTNVVAESNENNNFLLTSITITP